MKKVYWIVPLVLVILVVVIVGFLKNNETKSDSISVKIVSFEWRDVDWKSICADAKDRTDYVSPLNQLTYQLNYLENSQRYDCYSKTSDYTNSGPFSGWRSLGLQYKTSLNQSSAFNVNVLGKDTIKICCKIDDKEVCDSIVIPAKCDSAGKIIS